MTRESMIKVLCYKAEHIKTHIKPEFFLEVAEALEQQPKTDAINKSNFSQEQYKADLQCAYDCGRASVKPCEDAISRADAVKVASGYCHPQNIAEELAKLPPVTPARKKGYWIRESQENTFRNYCKCTLCGKGETYMKTPYCPNCGAKMIEPPESEDKE